MPIDFHENISVKIIFIVLIAAIGGFLFGYNTSIISGAILFLDQEFNLTPFMQGFLTSIILLGAILGTVVGGGFIDMLGRRMTLIANGFIYTIGIILVITANDLSFLLLGRFITGVGVGISSLAAPLYIAEISPSKWRGGLVAVNQLMISIGILAAYLVNYTFSISGKWQWMFGLALAPVIIQTIGMFFLPETLKAAHQEVKEKRQSLTAIKYALIIGVLLSIFQQITGINAVIYYASTIFQMSGFASATAATFAALSIGIVNVVATLFSIRLLDYKGRRWLLLSGTAGMCISLFIMAGAFWANQSAVQALALFSLMSYVIFFAIGLGPVTWVILSEIYPSCLRGKAMSIAIFANWLSNYLVALTFPDFIQSLGAGITFALYASICLGAFFFIRRYIPETKGKTFDEIQQRFYNN